MQIALTQKQKTRTIVAAMSVLVVALAAWLVPPTWRAVWEMRSALQQYEEAGGSAMAAAIATQLSKDFEAYGRCGPEQNASESRACIVTASHQVGTEAGAVMVAGLAYHWTLKNGQDADVRAAGLRAVAAGRQAMEANSRYLFTVDRLLLARQAVPFLGSSGPSGSHFARMWEALSLLELQLHTPAVADEQVKWLRRVAANK